MFRVNSPKYCCHVNRLCDWINAVPNYFRSHYNLSTKLPEVNFFSRVCLSFCLQGFSVTGPNPLFTTQSPRGSLTPGDAEPSSTWTSLCTDHPPSDTFKCVHHVARIVSKAGGWHSTKMPSFLNCFAKGSNCKGNNVYEFRRTEEKDHRFIVTFLH